jgi:hypothetical protein
LNDFGFAGRPTPFFRLACRILNVCANSATYERLWSVFGATLTKLRDRLGVKTPGELKIHIQDEHRSNETRSRLKRTYSERSKNQTMPRQPLNLPKYSLTQKESPPLKMKNMAGPRPILTFSRPDRAAHAQYRRGRDRPEAC